MGTTLTRNAPGGGNVTTYYFRTKFLITDRLNQISLVFSNLVDDGLIAYLNGHEIYRINMPDSPPPVTYSTFTPQADADGEGVWIVTNINSDLLLVMTIRMLLRTAVV